MPLDFKVARIFDHRLQLLSMEIANRCRINFDATYINLKWLLNNIANKT